MKIEEEDNIPCGPEQWEPEQEERLIEAINRTADALGEVATSASWIAAAILVLFIGTCAIAGAL